MKKILVLLSMLASSAFAQWQMPARQIYVSTNSFGAVPLTKTNVQLVIDWVDDYYSKTYTNDFNLLPDITTTLEGIWPYMTNVDNQLNTKYTNTFVLVPSITTNIFGLWSYLTNFDNLLNTKYTNTFTNMPSITTNIFGLWGFMTNVDSRVRATPSSDKQPFASFHCSTTPTNSATIYSDSQVVTNTLVYLSTNKGDTYFTTLETNGFTRTTTASDNYWVVPSNGLYLVNVSVGGNLNNTPGNFYVDISCNGSVSPVSGGQPVTQIEVNYTNALPFFYRSSSAICNWSAGNTIRVDAVTSVSGLTGFVRTVEFSARRLGNL